MDEQAPDPGGQNTGRPSTGQEHHAALEAAAAFDQRLKTTAIKTGAATLAVLLFALAARTFGVVVVATVGGALALLALDLVWLAWCVRQSPQLRFLGAVAKSVIDGREPFPMDVVLKRLVQRTAHPVRTPYWWYPWAIHAGYAACAGLVVASLANNTLGIGTAMLTIALRYWAQRALDKQMVAAADTIKLKNWHLG